MPATFGTVMSRHGVPLTTRRWDTGADAWASVLIVHGVGEHSGRYEHVAAFLNARGLDVYAYDHQGHGLSGGPRLHIDDFRHIIDDVGDQVALVRAAGKPVVMYGHSLGGLIALKYILDSGDSPDLLVLSAPALADSVPDWQRKALDVVGKLLPKTSIPTPVNEEGLSRNPSVGKAYLADPLVSTKGTLGAFREFFVAQDEANRDLHKLDVRTLVIHGGSDPIVPPAGSAPLAANPKVDRKLYPQLRHEMHNEPESDEVLGDVVDWIKQNV